MNPLEFIGPLTALAGHCVVWIYLANRIHAQVVPGRIPWREKLCAVCFLGIPLALAALSLRVGVVPGTPANLSHASLSTGSVYIVFCWLAFLGIAPQWLARRWAQRGRQRHLRLDDRRVVDIVAQEGECTRGLASLLARVPGNESFHLEVNQKRLLLDDLPPALNGLAIAHLSDLHMSGGVDRNFYRRVAEETCRLNADLVVLTGDIVESPECLEWIPDCLERIRAPLGCYFILGNHDCRIPVAPIRRAMRRAGWHDLGGAATTLSVGRNTGQEGARVLLAGSEWPWFDRPADALLGEPCDWRILLTHSPDEFPWARQQGFQLVLAGHTHGGQIQLPWLGPIFVPSTYGLRYADGVFWEAAAQQPAAGALMHVSRGVCGLHPIRWNCRPEITRLVLEPARQREQSAAAAIRWTDAAIYDSNRVQPVMNQPLDSARM